MNLEHRIHLLVELGNYCLSADPAWKEAKHRAHAENGWFTPEFIEDAVRQIGAEYLQKDKLTRWAGHYQLSRENTTPKNVGLIMAGNIPLVGFHDFLSVFMAGHRQTIKPSSRDTALIKHLLGKLTELDPEVSSFVQLAERLNGCDAYIATGSNNSARYFDYYFAKYPHIIRRNRSSVAILHGGETAAQLESLAGDVMQYFGLGCRNVTKLYVPEKYDFIPLLAAFRKYEYLADYAKYKHNYDYQLTILLLNNRFYMTNGTILLAESSAIYTPISVLNYEFYGSETAQSGSELPLPAKAQSRSKATRSPAGILPTAPESAQSEASQSPSEAQSSAELAGAERLSQQDLFRSVAANPDVQCIVGEGEGGIPFGKAQQPALDDYADGVDTLQFLRDL